MGKSHKELSRWDWSRSDGLNSTTEQLQLGCLQRIADATEAMTKNYVQMQKDLDFFKRLYQEEEKRRQQLERSIVAHKANYTRLKNKLEALENDLARKSIGGDSH